MTKVEEPELNKSYRDELKEQLTAHLVDDAKHQGDFQNQVREDCGTCLYLTKQIKLIETRPVRYYKPSG